MLKYIFSPQNIGNVTIANRLVVPAMVTNFCNEDGTATEKFIAYHEAKAKGGWGLIITEDYAVDPAGKGFSNVAGLWNDEQIAGHSELPRRVHKYDSKIFAQIYHCGRQTTSKANGNRKIVSASSIACPKTGSLPYELTTEEISEIIKQFGDTAKRAQECGFDGVEIHSGHGYLISQFLSAYSNKRTDKYGGSFLNRTNFLKEIMQEVRLKVGDNYPIIVRISAKEFMDGGIDIGDVRAIVMLMEQWGANALHISVGTYGDNSNVPSMHTSHGWIVDYAEEIKKVVSIPVITVGRINDPFIAEGVIAAGKADFVAMGRASIADPELPCKTKEERYQEIRNCIACMQGCTGLLHKDEAISCLVNPIIGKEYQGNVKRAEEAKKVLIVGGGPAGIEAAIGAALRGHKVYLKEKKDRLGGLFGPAGFPLAKGEFSNYLAWARQELARLDVDVELNSLVDSKMIIDMNPDEVVLAVGGKEFIPELPGIQSKKVISAVDVLTGRETTGKNVIVAGGGLVGIETAIFLGFYGKNVTVIEMMPEINYSMPSAIVGYLKALLKKYNVQILCCTKLLSVGANEIEVESPAGIERLACDNVCLALGYKKSTDMYQELLENTTIKTHIIGDANVPQNALTATKEGYLVGINI